MKRMLCILCFPQIVKQKTTEVKTKLLQKLKFFPIFRYDELLVENELQDKWIIVL